MRQTVQGCAVETLLGKCSSSTRVQGDSAQMYAALSLKLGKTLAVSECATQTQDNTCSIKYPLVSLLEYKTLLPSGDGLGRSDYFGTMMAPSAAYEACRWWQVWTFSLRSEYSGAEEHECQDPLQGAAARSHISVHSQMQSFCRVSLQMTGGGGGKQRICLRTNVQVI
jgi:hypothetical protein